MTAAPAAAPRAPGAAVPRRQGRIATLTALAALGVAFVTVAWSLPIDDFWGSIASGRAILNGADPSHAVPLTWLPILPDAINPQWGAQVILAAVNALGWALAVNALLLAIGLGLTFERMRRRADGAALAVASLLLLAVLSVHLLARAQSFSISLFPLGLLLLERVRSRWWLPVAFGALLAAWANLHGAFVVGQLAAGCWLLGAVWSWWRARDAAARRPLLIYAVTFVLSLVAPLLNPAGARLLSYAYGQGASELVRAISVEWQPSSPWEPVGLLFWLLAAAIVAGRLLRRGGAPPAELLLLLGTGALAATGIRHIPWFALAAAPVLASDVGSLLKTRRVLGRAMGELPPMLCGARLTRLLAGAAVLAVVLQPVRTVLPAGIARLTPDEPVDVIDPLSNSFRDSAAASHARYLNEQVWGGYLEWKLGPVGMPAIDGRIEIHDEQTWRDYFALMAGEADVAQRLAAEHVVLAFVFPTRTQLLGRLHAAGWHEVRRTSDAVLLSAP